MDFQRAFPKAGLGGVVCLLQEAWPGDACFLFFTGWPNAEAESGNPKFSSALVFPDLRFFQVVWWLRHFVCLFEVPNLLHLSTLKEKAPNIFTKTFPNL